MGSKGYINQNILQVNDNIIFCKVKLCFSVFIHATVGTGFASIGLRGVFCKNWEKQLFVR